LIPRWRPLRALTAGLALVLAATAASAGDLAAVRASGVLRQLGVRYANFVTAQGSGFDVELIQGFAQSIGVRHELVYSDFYNVVQDLIGADFVRDGDQARLRPGQRPVRGDLIASGLTVLPWRQTLVAFSAPTFPSQVMLVTRAESTARPVSKQPSLQEEIRLTRAVLGRKSLLVMEKTCLDPSNYGLNAAAYDLRRHKPTSNLDEMVPALLNGAAEFTLLDVPDVVLDLHRWSGRIQVIGPISGLQDLAVAFPKSSPELRAAFDAYLAGLRQDGRYDSLVDKHYPGIRLYFPAFFARRS